MELLEILPVLKLVDPSHIFTLLLVGLVLAQQRKVRELSGGSESHVGNRELAGLIKELNSVLSKQNEVLQEILINQRNFIQRAERKLDDIDSSLDRRLGKML